MSRNLIAIDPGPHCGVAVFTKGVFSHSVMYPNDCEKGHTVKEQYELIQQLFLWAVDGEYTFVVEDFRTQMPLSGEGADTLKLIGWVKGLCMKNSLDCFFQLPAVRLPFLQPAGKVKPSPKTGHEIDAIAHGLAWLARHG